MKEVLLVCAYAAEYGGNFIASLTALEKELELRGLRTVYCFPERARGKDWCCRIEERTQVYFLPEAKARILPKTYRIFKRIYREHDISIVHSHFELYDMPATVTAPKTVKIFWHLHDPLSLTGTNRDILWKIQYGRVGRRATLIAVADAYRRFVISLGFPEEQSCVVWNGISLGRIDGSVNPSEQTGRIPPENEKKYDFLAFGWDFHRKGDDLILQAASRLWKEGYRFTLYLNGNEKTWEPLDAFLEHKKPEYLICGDPQEDVAALFAEARVFIQASRKEACSYAVCEAAYAGLPVICSEIPGHALVYDLPTVRFFESENADALYQCMKDYLDADAQTDEKALDRTRAVIREQYSLEAWSRKILEIYGF